MRIHQVHRLYQSRLSRAVKPFKARGSKVLRCPFCQIMEQHCVCSFQPSISSDLAALIIMSDNEILKPSNTGRLIADILEDTYAFQWSRTNPEPALIELLNNSNYDPIIIFPEAYVDDKSRLINLEELLEVEKLSEQKKIARVELLSNKKPLLIFLDGSWREARKMFRHSSYLNQLSVLSLDPQVASNYQIRKSDNDNHLATAEVASMVLEILGDTHASKILSLWFDVFKEGYLLSKTRLKHDFSKPMLTKYIEYTGNIG